MRLLTNFLLMIILFSGLVFADYSGTISLPEYSDEEWDSFFETYDLPSSTMKSIYVDSTIMPINLEILEDKGLLVYGDANLVKVRNDFKDDTRNESGVGYYLENGVYGEYRYHGHSENGGLVGNADFPRDGSSSTPLEEKEWVITPWNPGTLAKASFDRIVIKANYLNLFAQQYKDYTEYDLQNMLSPAAYEELNKLKDIAREGLDFDIKWGTFNGIDIQTVLDPIYYANLEAVPTTRLSGQTRMFHQSKWDGNVWYQTFPIKRTEGKIETSLETTVADYRISAIDEIGTLKLMVKVEAHLLDDSFYVPYNELLDEEDLIDNTTRYHRDDIKSWDLSLSSNLPCTVEKSGSTSEFNGGNKAYQWFEMTLEYADYETLLSGEGTDLSLELLLRGEAYANYTDNLSVYDSDEIIAVVDTGRIEVIETVEFEVNAPHEILDVWAFDLELSELNVPEGFTRTVIVEGQVLSHLEEIQFFNGTYQFPLVRETKLYNYSISYSNGEDTYFYASWVLVYDSTPYASVKVTDYGKVNRKNTVRVDTGVTPTFVRQNTSITISEFSLTSRSGQIIYYDLNSVLEKDYMIKEIDTVDLKVTTRNEYGSRSYHYEIYAGEDYKPDLISIIWNNNLARYETLDVFSEGASLDDDTVASVYYEVFFDRDKDGIAEESVFSKREFLGSCDYVPTSLGYYEIEFTVTESFGQATIETYISPEDYKTQTVRREFFVENLVPMAKVYSDIDFNYPELDVVFLVDEAFPSDEMDYIRSSSVDIKNSFRLNNMVASLQIWDLHTYTYSQTANYRMHTGASYPPSTYNYNSGGYSGLLSRYDVDNYRYSRDNGEYVTTVSSKPATDTEMTSGIGSSGSTPPSSIYYSSGGYTGILYETSYTYWSENIYDDEGNYIDFRWTRTKTYAGTVTKSTTVWVPDIDWYNNYYGDYSGTVYKDVKQTFDPIFSTQTGKYIVYFSKASIQNLQDFNSIYEIIPESKIILVSDPLIIGGLTETHHMPYRSETESLVNDIIEVVKDENPYTNALTVLIDEAFILNTSTIDIEGDPIVEERLQYVHDPNYFDNSEGLEDSSYISYDESQYTSSRISSFSKPGKYSIYMRSKDAPIEDLEQGKYSNESKLDILVHRKPVALDYMDWTYDPDKELYQIDWMDLSYDPDYEFSEPNKGIVDIKMRYKKDDEDWVYHVPLELMPGSYVRELIVQDAFGIWSDRYTDTFILSEVPAPQILSGQLNAKVADFSLSSMPHTEYVTLSDLVVRFPYDVDLKYEWLYKNQSVLSGYFSPSVSGIEELVYEDFDFIIPKEFVNGTYQLMIYAVDHKNTSNYDSLLFNVQVNTPFDLSATLPTILTPGENLITCHTSEYVDAVNLVLYIGTSYEKTLAMTLVDGVWQHNELPPDIADDIYQFRFEALIYSTPYQTETLMLSSEYVGLAIQSITIEGMWNYYDGNENIFYEAKSYEPHRFLSMEQILMTVEAVGQPDCIEVMMSDELMAMFYTDNYGNAYSYETFMGYSVVFPLQMDTIDQKNFSESYVLPLANSTKSEEDTRLRSPYFIEFILIKDDQRVSYYISDIEITGNTLDHIYLEPYY